MNLLAYLILRRDDAKAQTEWNQKMVNDYQTRLRDSLDEVASLDEFIRRIEDKTNDD